MHRYPNAANKDCINPEEARLEAVRSYDILNTVEEAVYDRLANMAAEICGTPIALITILDDQKQWFKSHVGLEIRETPRELAFCNIAIQHPHELLLIPDATQDDRFSSNPYVCNDPNIRFYAGAPLVTPDGYALGTLCVIDDKAKELDNYQRESLKLLAEQVMLLLEMRKANKKLRIQQAVLEERNKSLERFAYVVSHDLKSPLNNISSLTELIMNNRAEIIPKEALLSLGFVKQSADSLREMIDGILAYHKTDSLVDEAKTTVLTNEFLEEITHLFYKQAEFKLDIAPTCNNLNIQKHLVQQVIINLVSNGIKYNDSKLPEISLHCEEDEDHYIFEVNDNGKGIALEDRDKVFELFTTLGYADRYKQQGTGIGLASVKKLVTAMGGTIHLHSVQGLGSTFQFSIAKT